MSSNENLKNENHKYRNYKISKLGELEYVNPYNFSEVFIGVFPNRSNPMYKLSVSFNQKTG